MSNKEYFVDRIEDKRTVNGRTEYYLKWKGDPRSNNSWEPVDNLSCPDLVKLYEESLKNKKDEKLQKRKNSTTPDVIKAKRKAAEEDSEECCPIGFDRGLKPSKIIAATDSSGELMFLMKFQGSDRADLVPAKTANIICPQVVIQFYEESLAWQTSQNDENAKPPADNENF